MKQFFLILSLLIAAFNSNAQCVVNASMNVTLNPQSNVVTVENTTTVPLLPNQNRVEFSRGLIDWGDGAVYNIPQTHHNYPPPHNLTATHEYCESGVYTIKLVHEWSDTNYNPTHLCKDSTFFTVTISNEISGTVSLDANSIDTNILWNDTALSFNVLLFKKEFDAMNNAYYPLEGIVSTNRDSMYRWAFYDKPDGEYYLLAKVTLATDPTLIFKLFPTYFESTTVWGSAKQIVFDGCGGSLDNQIVMKVAHITTGNWIMGGNVSRGAGKGTSNGVPDQLIYLRDISNNSILQTYTDINGDYTFDSLPDGNYTIYPEEIGYTTTPSSLITLNANTPTHNNIDFEIIGNTIVPKSTSSINPIWNNIFSIYPNPANGIININWKNKISDNAQIHITDISGRVVYTLNEKVSSINSIDITNFSTGIYFIKVIAEQGVYVEKLVVE